LTKDHVLQYRSAQWICAGPLFQSRSLGGHGRDYNSGTARLEVAAGEVCSLQDDCCMMAYVAGLDVGMTGIHRRG